jgi:hypothetical protein
LVSVRKEGERRGKEGGEEGEKKGRWKREGVGEESRKNGEKRSWEEKDGGKTDGKRGKMVETKDLFFPPKISNFIFFLFSLLSSLFSLSSPPELLLGAKEYSSSIDIWSIGCVACEMLALLPPFPGYSVQEMMSRVRIKTERGGERERKGEGKGKGKGNAGSSPPFPWIFCAGNDE